MILLFIIDSKRNFGQILLIKLILRFYFYNVMCFDVFLLTLSPTNQKL
jgi:hypothetical protein